jgi:hypothetical protein
LIVNKVLANEGDRPKVDSIVNSFFAGCKKYDLYDLARIYNTVPLLTTSLATNYYQSSSTTEEQFEEAIQNHSTRRGNYTNRGVLLKHRQNLLRI